MKTLHISIIIIISVLVIIASSDWVYAQLLPGGNLAIRLISIPKSNFVDGEIIPISGYGLPNSTIIISLSDNLGNLENLTRATSNDTGYFYTSLGIPSHVLGGGSWQIMAINDGLFKSYQIQVNTHGVVTMPTNFPSRLLPLKQFKLGIPTNTIQCHSGFQLVVKKENGQPTCVKLDTAYTLIKRGWATSESAYPEGNAQFSLQTNSTIIPGNLQRHSSVKLSYQESSRVINYSGFDGMYNETLLYHGTQQDYVLKPGNTGTITFKIDVQASGPPGQMYPIPLPKSLNMTNYAVFYHEITSLEELSKYPGVTFNGNHDFSACFTRPGGGDTCIGETFEGKTPIEAYVTDHPGVNVLFEPPAEVMPFGTNTTSQVVTMMIAADRDASQGTYLVEPSPFGSDTFLLTVGNQPYHE